MPRTVAALDGWNRSGTHGQKGLPATAGGHVPGHDLVHGLGTGGGAGENHHQGEGGSELHGAHRGTRGGRTAGGLRIGGETIGLVGQ